MAPPIEKESNAPFFAKGEKIVLKRDGTWESDGVEITHEPTRELFYRSIERDLDKGYLLHIGFERMLIEVEDTPYFVKEIQKKGKSLSAVLSNQENIPVVPNDLTYQNETLYLELPKIKSRARFLSAPYYDLMKHLEEDEKSYFIKLGLQRVDLLKKKA